MKKSIVALLCALTAALSLVTVGMAATARMGAIPGIYAKVTISATPESKTVAVGEQVKFSVKATGTGKLTYQWQTKSPSGEWKNSTSASAKTANFTLTAQAGHNGYMFRCIVKDEGGSSATTEGVKLTVTAAFTDQPKDKTAGIGEKAEFSVTVNGKSPFSYQWQSKSPSGDWKNSSAAGAKTATLSITVQSGHNGYQFRCVVTDGNGNKANSEGAKLTVAEASGINITKQPKATTVPVGGQANFTIAATGTGTISYQWQTKSPNGSWKNSSSASAKKAKFTITAQTGHNGFQVRCVVKDSKESKTSEAVTLSVRPGIISQTEALTVIEGDSATFSVEAEGVGPLSYQWQTRNPNGDWKNSTSASAKRADFTLTVRMGHNGYQFRCVITDANGKKTTTQPADLTVEEMGIPIDENYFPDCDFCEYVSYLDCNGDGYLSNSEISAVTAIDIDGLNIGDLDGIGVFTELRKLRCSNNSLADLDVTNNKKLTFLDCSQNHLEVLNLNENTALTYLDCGFNDLTNLFIDQVLTLEQLYCTDNLLRDIEPGENHVLRIIKCTHNNITELRFDSLWKLEELWVDSIVESIYCEGDVQIYMDGSAAQG